MRHEFDFQFEFSQLPIRNIRCDNSDLSSSAQKSQAFQFGNQRRWTSAMETSLVVPFGRIVQSDPN